MITFLTLFLGLVHGVHPVELAAEPPVARVELLLDGEPVGAADAPPFSFEVDFGAEPAPHRLTAIGRDSEGREVDRAALAINLIDGEHLPAEVSLAPGAPARLAGGADREHRRNRR